jgi:hypothetical protein
MARPVRKNVDYFPHYISDGKKMFYIEQKYGNDGYAIWFKMLEMLASSDDHWINLNDKSNIMFMSAKCRVSEETLFSILNDLSDLNQINPELWSAKIIWSEKFTESIQDAYIRRNNKCMTLEGLCMHLLGLGIHLPHSSGQSVDINTQTKVNYNKVNNPLPPKGELTEREKKFLEWFNNLVGHYTGKKGKFKTMSDRDKRNLKKLRSAYEEPQDWNHAFKMMFNSEWVQTNSKLTVDHFLINGNFTKYLNQQDLTEQPAKFKAPWD